MFRKWIQSWREARTQNRVQALTRELAERQPPDWRSIDDEVIKWPKAGQMWEQEVRILKKLSKCGQVAKGATDAILSAAEMNLWGHHLRKNGAKEKGRSILSGPAMSGHRASHARSLLWCLLALRDIGADNIKLVEFLLEAIHETEPPSEDALEGFRRSCRQSGIGPLDDYPLRGVIRAAAVTVLVNLVPALAPTGMLDSICTDVLKGALTDPNETVRFSTLGALSQMRPFLHVDTVGAIRSSVLSVCHSPELAKEITPEAIRKWEST